jgi:hypothetical protein
MSEISVLFETWKQSLLELQTFFPKGEEYSPQGETNKAESPEEKKRRKAKEEELRKWKTALGEEYSTLGNTNAEKSIAVDDKCEVMRKDLLKKIQLAEEYSPQGETNKTEPLGVGDTREATQREFGKKVQHAENDDVIKK